MTERLGPETKAIIKALKPEYTDRVFRTEAWLFEYKGGRTYKGVIDAGIHSIAMTGADVAVRFSIPFYHKLKRILLYHTTAAGVAAITDFRVILDRTLGTMFPEAFTERLVDKAYVTNSRIGIELFKDYETSTWTLTLNGIATDLVFPIIYVEYLGDDLPTGEVSPPSLNLDGAWNPESKSRLIYLLQVTTNAYVTMGTIWMDCMNHSTIKIRETVGANGITYQIDASMDNVNWTNLLGATAVAAGAQAPPQTLNDAWRFLRVMIMSTLAGFPGTVEVYQFGEKM